MSLKLGRSIDVGLALDRVLVLQVEPGDLQVRLQLVVDAVLLLAGLKRNADLKSRFQNWHFEQPRTKQRLVKKHGGELIEIPE